MIPLRIIMEGDGAFQNDIETNKWQGGTLDAITVLEASTISGKPSVALLVKCADGTIVIAETTWALLHAAVRAFEAKIERME